MALFLSDQEHKAILAPDRAPRLSAFYWALQRRTDRRVHKPGLLVGDETADWWRPVSEYLTDAAMVHALKPSEATAVWLRDVTLSLVRRPQDDWVGPPYREHRILDDGSQIGHLETAHFCWAIAIVLDLAGDVFTDAERDEAAGVLRERGALMCINWLDRPHSVANWWCVLSAGLTVAAAALDDEALLARARHELAGCVRVFQADGSYGESLQYGNYAIYTLMLASEALRRRGEAIDGLVPLGRYIGYARWAAASYLYTKPTTGWGPAPKPRSLNFNDSGAVFKPTADLLLHLAARGRDSHPAEAGLARWLFEQTYDSHLQQGPHDQASFDLRSDWGFLTLPLLPAAAEPLAPADAGLPTTCAFDCGNSIVRDAWDGRTVLAMHGGGEKLHGPGHLHRDLNSLILAHNHERLLTDAGHSCYRNTLRRLEVSTQMHNTCTFQVTHDGGDQPMENWTADRILEQHDPPRRTKHGDNLSQPIDRGAKRLIAAELGEVRVIGSDAAAAYGRPIERFARFVFLCGSHAVFIVDHIVSARPVRTRWHWLLNNRDGELDLKVAGKDRVVARRGNAGMKLFSLSGGSFDQRWAHVNDAYHCMPGQMGEGRPGSGILLRWTEAESCTERLVIHAIVLDTCGTIAGWHLRRDAGALQLEAPHAAARWTLRAATDNVTVEEPVAGLNHRLQADAHDRWTLHRES